MAIGEPIEVLCARRIHRLAVRSAAGETGEWEPLETEGRARVVTDGHSAGPLLLLRTAGRDVARIGGQVHPPQNGIAPFVPKWVRRPRRLIAEDKHHRARLREASLPGGGPC